MQPGTLCPSDYLTWKGRQGASWFIFQPLADSDAVMKRFMDERKKRALCEDDLDLIAAPQRITRTWAEIRFDAIIDAYEANSKNAQAACRELGISKATFYRELSRNNYRIGRVMKKKETKK